MPIELAELMNKIPQLLGISTNKFGMAFKMRIKFDTKLPPHELITDDIRFNNPGWGDDAVYPHPIEYLEFFLPIPYKLVLFGMESYNFFIEALGSMGSEKLKIDSFWFCGKLPDTPHVNIWKIKQGVIDQSTALWGREYNGTASRGWRLGTPHHNHFAQLFKL